MTDQSPSPYSGLIERLNKVESGADCNPGRTGMVTNWHRNPDGPEAASAIRDLEAEHARKDAALAAMWDAADGLSKAFVRDGVHGGPKGTAIKNYAAAGRLARAALSGRAET